MGPDGRLLRRFGALRSHAAVSLAAAGAVAVAVLVQAEALATGLTGLVDGDRSALGPLVVALVAVGVVRGLARWATDRSAGRAVAAMRRDIVRTVVDRLDRMDQPARAAVSPSELTALATSGAHAAEPWVRAFVPAAATAAIVPLTAGLWILAHDRLSAFILVVSVPLIPVFMVLIGRLTQARSDREWATLQRLGAHFHDVLVGMPTLRVFGRADVQVARVRAVTDQYRRAVLGTLRVAFLSALALELLATMSVALVAVTAGWRLTEGRLDLRAALVVLLLAPECSLPLRRVGAAFHAATAGNDAMDELDAIEALGMVSDGPAVDGPDGASRVRLDGVTVTGSDRGPRVTGATLDATAGELLALTGPTGAGKSSLLAAVAGRVPADGVVEVDGRPVGEWSRVALRRRLVEIPQHPRPLGRTVRESVEMGLDAGVVDDALIHDALIDDALVALDLGPLVDRSPEVLSGGERRRVAVARAVVAARTRPVSVVLADEPTAHLDEAHATAVIAALRELAASGAAVVVASHDPAVAAAADRVVTIPGRVVDAPVGGRRAGPRHGPAPQLVPEPLPGETTPLAAVTPDDGATWIDDLRWLRSLAAGDGARLAAARALGIVAEGCSVALAAVAAWLIVRAAEQPSFADLAIAAVGVRAFGIGKGVVRYAERLASHDTTLRQLGRIRASVIARVARLAPAALPRGRGDVLAAVVDDVDRLGDLELRVVGPAVSAVTVAVAAVAATAALVGAPAAVLALAVVAVAVALPAWVAAGAARTGARIVSARAAVAATVLDLAERAEEVAALGATGRWSHRIHDAVTAIDDAEAARHRRGAVASGLVAAAGAWTAAGVAAAAGVASPAMSGPVLATVVLLPLAVLDVLAPGVSGAELVSDVAASASRLRRLLSLPDPAPDPDAPVEAPDRHDLALVDLRLAWPGGPTVVDGLDLDLPAGATARLLGPSGAGKSTVAAALVRFLLPSSGRALLGGADITAMRGDDVRAVVGWATQDPWLGRTSIRENLRVGDPDADDDRMWAALATAGIDTWAAALPAGLDTELGNDGATASGGERQRLALARMLLADHRVVVLDEPSAHLDAATAERVLPALAAAMADRSLVLISHDVVPIAVDVTVEIGGGAEPDESGGAALRGLRVGERQLDGHRKASTGRR